jgi:hypothetical protein
MAPTKKITKGYLELIRLGGSCVMSSMPSENKIADY